MKTETLAEQLLVMIQHLLTCYVPVEVCPMCQEAQAYVERLKKVVP